MLKLLIRAACLLVLVSAPAVWWTRASVRSLYGEHLASTLFLSTAAGAALSAAVLLCTFWRIR